MHLTHEDVCNLMHLASFTVVVGAYLAPRRNLLALGLIEPDLRAYLTEAPDLEGDDAWVWLRVTERGRLVADAAHVAAVAALAHLGPVAATVAPAPGPPPPQVFDECPSCGLLTEVEA